MTNSEYLAYMARKPQRTLACEGVPCVVESDLHEQIFAECRRRGWLALHGAMSERTHRTAGEWDFTILADAGRTFFVECKTKTGKLSPEQAGLHHWAQKLGHIVYVVRSFEDFLEVIK